MLEEIVYNSVFIHSRKCSLFLLDFFANLVPVIKRVKYLYCFMWFLLYHLLHLFSSNFTATHFFFLFFWNIWIFKNRPWRRLSRNVNFSNLGNVFYREILKQTGPGSAFLEHLETQILKNLQFGAFVGSMYVPVCK